MNSSFARGMSRATELTRSGNLGDATALIQSLLQGQPAAANSYGANSYAEGQFADGDVIEGTFTRLDDAATRPNSTGASSTGSTNSGPSSIFGKTAARKVRKGLGETLRGIAADGMPQRGVMTPMPLDLPDGAQFLSLTHSGSHGRRDYRLYVPVNQPEGPMPLIVMLHGCTQSPEDFAVGTGMNAQAEEFGCLIAWPAQPQGANVQKCWNWFRPEDQARDCGEPALIAGIIGDILRDHPADPARVYIAGLSAGGAAAAIMGTAYPDLFAAVGVHSGLPVGGAIDVPSAFAAMRSGSTGKVRPMAVPAIVFHGLADQTVHPGNGDAVVAQALQSRPGLKRVHVTGVSDGGRTYRQTRHDDAEGRSIAEHWEIDGAGHAWAGGRTGGSYTDPKGPDASREMLRFFLQHTRT
ncbi:PHB depolymerase family esterase [Fodinicurvata sp. EGI_FJ10296]|uniref:extracellular catalytic domain type 1 short-chain-length polyhydroxyalkanoate depolymerase n=1 Tax=Fodinicurvata sp. EGI_FJ10296 TaxID=3231908 RepID=UPI003457052F